MTRANFIGKVLAFVLALGPTYAFAAFQSIQTQTVTAGVTVGPGTNLIINAGLLPTTAFYGKNVVIPVTVRTADGSDINSQGLSVDFAYQNLDSNGQPTGALTTSKVTFRADPSRRDTLIGSANIVADQLFTIRQGGTFQYFFRALQSGGDLVLSRAGLAPAPAGTGLTIGAATPFTASILTSMSAQVSPQGSTVLINDTYLGDGKTAITFPPGALSGPGTLVIRAGDTTVVRGPRGATPAVVYDFDLQGATLQREMQLTLSYPSEIDGKVSGSRANPLDLAPYYFDGFEWRILGRPGIDTTLHTVRVNTNRFSSFALFATGPVAASDIRPAQRIITPNGDGINDTADFTGLTAGETVQIFDVRGRRVRKLSGSVSWDGRDDDGSRVESGVYLYQYKSQGERVSGVIVVAK